jgi:uncharacterized phage protein gp47/JayE
MTSVTSLGFLRTRLDERLATLVADYKAIYGDDIMVEPDDLDGEFLGILAERFSDLDQLAEDVYNSFNPQLATGVALSRLVELNKIKRISGDYSTADVVLGGTVNTVIPAESLVKSTVDGTSWRLTADVTISASGTVTATVQRTEQDATAASAGTLTKIDTPIYGWQTVTNPNIAVPGRLEETDEQLRTRRKGSTNTPAQSILDSVYGAIANLSGVRLARVYENYTDAVDSNGQAAHSIYAVVEGGIIQDIGQTIWIKKTAGTSTIGSTPVTVTDTQGGSHVINFDRPSYSDVYITVTLTKFAGYPTDGAAQIKAALVDWALNGPTGDGSDGLAIGEDVIQSRLYDPANVANNYAINSITLGLTASPVGTSNIVVPFNGLARFDAARIVVVEL